MKTSIRKATLCCATSLTAFAALSAPAYAQDEAAQSADDQATENVIIVTGSITRNPAAATASPVVSVTSEDLDNRGIKTVSEALQTLTANNAGTIPASWSGNGFTTGATAPSLRGFNNAYTLTLFDGMRSAYYPLADDGQRNIVDINSMPGSITERVDTLLDGASATYGSDAIAGVVNVITKREIQGLHLDASMGLSQRGEGDEPRLNATYGYGDLDDQGFNVYANFEYQKNSPVDLRDRKGPWGTADQSSICGTTEDGCLTNNIRNGIQADGSYNSFQSTIVNFVQPFANPNNDPLGDFELLNPAAGCGPLDSVTLTDAQRGDTDAPSVVCQQDLTHDYEAYTARTKRIGGTLRGTARLGDDTEAYLMFNYYNVTTANRSAPYGWTGRTAAGGDRVTISRIYLPAYVCSEGVGVIDDSGNLLGSGCDASNGTRNPNNPYAARGYSARLLGMPDQPRWTYTNAKTYRLSGGVNGSFGDSWEYSVGATASEVTLDVTNTGYILAQGLMDAVAQGTYNFVDPSANSQDVVDSIFPDQHKRATSKLAQVIGTLSKDVFELPGGFVNVAVAGQYRYEKINNPSSNAPNAENPADRYYSINAIGVRGHRDVWSASYEISVPVLDELRFKADGSYDHYSTGQENFAPKFEAEFSPIEQVKLRGTFSKGFRAPNLNESFQLPSTGYTSATINCNTAAYEAFCAAHASNPSYYEGGYSPGVTSAGNPDLKSEKSTSYTFGVVVQPTRRITLTLDYWRTKINNLITPVNLSDEIYAAYYGNNGVVNIPGIEVTQGAPDPENPGALPLLGEVSSSFQNADSMLGKGIDFSANALFDVTNTVSWRTNATASYLIRLQQTVDGSVNRFDGSLGGCNWTSCSGAPRFRAAWQNTLDFNDRASLTLTAYYTSGYSSTASDAGGTYKDCAASAAAGQLVTYPDSGNPVQCHGPSTFDLDGHGETKVGDNFTVYFDVLNILDGKPKYDPNAAYGIYNFNAAWQDRLFMGRYFRIGAKVDF
ncbi:TonB-dependent receptor [Altericroceibacterium spongiae]|uniref:TonB-dependent receptor n=1 Tax=Altericroceibacterium spongiae TaxID=2320269 RepID=A0A420EFB6_9SPHN|nr:TonB-dependent receptor [Altericroceibacterium spongiae]RKF19363.1 TonB-dependent receptor [Altericroceibacterium spongiae]